MSAILAAEAVRYADLGFAVFPCLPQAKEPAVAGGVKSATRDLAQIKAWWENRPDANIGLACGDPSGVIVIDLDDQEAYAAFVGEFGVGTAETVSAATANGYHLFFKLPELAEGERIPNRVQVRAKMDVRATGGYVIAAPSIHPSGAQYTWITDPEINEPLALPDEVRALIVRKDAPPVASSGRSVPELLAEARAQGAALDRYAQAALEAECSAVASHSEGGRNHRLNRAAFALARFVGAGTLSEGLVISALASAGRSCGLEDEEIQKTIASGLSKGRSAGRSAATLERFLAKSERQHPEGQATDQTSIPHQEATNSEDEVSARVRGIDPAGSAAPKASEPPPIEDLSDTGIASHLGGTATDRILYLPDAKTWLAYDASTGLWREEATDGSAPWAEVRRVTESQLQRITAAADERDRRRRLLSLRDTTKIESVVRAMRHEPRFSRTKNDFDRARHLFPTSGKVIDLRTGEIIDVSPQLMMSRGGTVSYNPDARCPRWLQFLEEATQDDPDMQAFLKRAVGYTLTGETKEQVFFFLHGEGGNGKGTFVRTVKKIVGDDFFSKLPESAIVLKSRGHQPDRERLAADLPGVRFVLGDEVQHGVLNVGFIKELTGEDIVRRRHLYREAEDFTPVAKLWLAGNKLPLPPDVDIAIRRRCRRLRFYFDAAQKPDFDLGKKLDQELEGILAWAVAGAREWYEHGLNPPSSVKDATDEYLDAGDWLRDFSEECLDFNSEYETTTKELWRAYVAWCSRESQKQVLTKGAQLVSELFVKGVKQARTNKRRFYSGVRVRPGTPMDITGWVPAGALPPDPDPWEGAA